MDIDDMTLSTKMAMSMQYNFYVSSTRLF